MSNILKLFIIAILIGGVFFSCDDLLDVESKQYLPSDENDLDNPNDSVYSMMGILNQVRDLSERIVLFGELRGDLMETTSLADVDLQKINDFRMSEIDPSANQLFSIRDFYKVINSCNYFINNIDTSTVVVNGQSIDKVMLPEFVQAKTIRAWTYLQMLTIYQQVVYLTDPILSVEDAFKNYQAKGMEEILDSLIVDLEPWTGVRYPLYGSVGDFESDYLFFPTEFVLGDLYLWRKQYQKAAETYYNLINRQSLTINETYRSNLYNEATRGITHKWNNIFKDFTGEVFTIFPYESLTVGISNLYNLSYIDYEIAPSQTYIDLCMVQKYEHYDKTNKVYYRTEGDLRGKDESFEYLKSVAALGILSEGVPGVMKYRYYSGHAIYVYRTSQLYLRYAEALNQLDKPSLALAVVNMGLKAINYTPEFINAGEITPIEWWFDFRASKFDSNIGTRQRGLGISNSNYLEFDPLEDDSVKFVEEVLRDELAFELAFEGNRFSDLMRMARHRNNLDLLASPISKKHGENSSAIYNLLLDEKNWFMPLSKK